MGYRSEFYSREFKSISPEYPSLQLVFEGRNWQLKGCIEIKDEFGKVWDTYNVKVIYPSKFPKEVPILYEVGGRIPKDDEHHINMDGSCCLSIPALEMITLKKGITTSSFLKELAIPFLANQTYKRKTGKFAGDEFRHGVDGLYQFYSDTFSTKDLCTILTLLAKIVLNQLPERNELCSCESGRKYKHCHLRAVQYLSPVSSEILINDYQFLYDAVQVNLQK